MVNSIMQRMLLLSFILTIIKIQAQNLERNISGGYETYLQYYQNDKSTNFEAPSDKLRSMNYFSTQYNYKDFSFGIQYEAFLPQPFLGYNPKLNKNKIATYFAQYKNNNFEIIAGYFYDQFGSGLVFRSWQDRQLGIDNSIKGLRIRYNFNDFIDLRIFTGNQRLCFDVSKSTLYGGDVDISLTNLLKLKKINLKTAFSYVARYENTQNLNPTLKSIIGNYSSRINLNVDNFYTDFEYVYKETDSRAFNQILLDQVLFDGDAWLLNMGYFKKGLGLNATFRRLENIQIYSEHLLEGNAYNTGVINFIPGLVKQHDISLANIYVYQSQPSISFEEKKVGEIGGQFDLFYTFKRNSFWGGKYGTKLAINFSEWHGLKANFDIQKQTYTPEFLATGELYFQDFNFEIRKKLSKKIKSILTFINLKYNKPKLEGEGDFIKASIQSIDLEYKLQKKQSLRIEIEHLYTKNDMRNWIADLFEFNFNHHFNIYASDMYNYGNSKQKIHYFNLGATYTKSSSRLSLNYGKQQGGLLCVGGVCRYMPANKGLTLNLSLLF